MDANDAEIKAEAAEVIAAREREHKDFRTAMLSLFEDLHETSEEVKRLSLAIEHSVNVIVIAGEDGSIEYLNPVFEKKVGYSKDDLTGRQMREYLFGELSDEKYQELLGAALSGKTWRGMVRNRRKYGGYCWFDADVCMASDESGKAARFLIVMEDVSEKMLSEARLKHLVVYDELTGLFNRAHFMNMLGESLASSEPCGGLGVLLLFDMDQFKFFNETYGHGTGDYMLKSLANLFNDVLEGAYADTGAKKACKPYIGRVGGDEFAVFLPSMDAGSAMKIAELLRVRVEDFRYESLDVSSTVSIGAAVYPEHGTAVKDLLTKADAARYRAKEAGRNRCHLYRPEDQDLEKMHSKLGWREKIVAAVKEDRFEPWFQPILDIRQNRVSHYEVLARMIEADGSIVFPGSFVDVAEWFGIITSIDRIIIEKALAHLARAGNGVNMSINLSGKELGDEGLLAFLRLKITETGADAAKVIFEITETAAIANIEQAVEFVKSLKSLGCKFALDDFGAGFTSFTYLKRLMVNYIKIDGAFVRRLHENADDQIFVKAIIDVARGLGIKTIAEFVEYEESLDILKTLGADYAQGYLIGKPAPSGDIIKAV